TLYNVLQMLTPCFTSARLRSIIVSSPSGSYLNKRLLKLNVGFLLSEGPGNARHMPINIPERVQVDDDLYLESLSGELLLTRTKEGILAQGTLKVANERECDRCLDIFIHRFDVPVEELFAYPADEEKSVFSVDSTGDINLAPLLREEVLIEESYRVICRDDCQGLSVETGVNLNHEPEHGDVRDIYEEEDTAIDPRLAVLKQLLD
ncbi:MAG: hypothetical protein CUN57_00825, partial [Phototrophicales bacterium]